jgi:hypothetical protein
MKLDELIQEYGSEIKVAAELGFSHQSVKNWKDDNGNIPFNSQCVIEVKTKGKFKAEQNATI